MTIDQHLEHHLGPIQQGWGCPSSGVQVCLFRAAPFEDLVTYSTLGLSHHVLTMKSGRQVRQELVLSVRFEFANDNLAKLLLHVSDQVIATHRAMLRGELVDLQHSICPGSEARQLYATVPVVFPDGFASSESTEPPTVFAWLIAVADSEAMLVQTRGWSQFEDMLETANPDLFDLRRRPIA